MKKDCYIVYNIIKDIETKEILEFNFLNCFETEEQAKASILYEVVIAKNEFGRIGKKVDEGFEFETFNPNEVELLMYSNEVSFNTKEEPLFIYNEKNLTGKSVCISLKTIYENLGTKLNSISGDIYPNKNTGYIIEHTTQSDGEEYYDLKSQFNGGVIHCDGESAKVIEIKNNFITLLNETTDQTFELSREEFLEGYFYEYNQLDEKLQNENDVLVFCDTFSICDFVSVSFPCGIKQTYMVSEILLDKDTQEVAAMLLKTHKEGDPSWIVRCDYYLQNKSMFKKIYNDDY